MTPLSSTSAPPQEFLATHCIACHNDRSRTAGVSFIAVDVNNIAGNAELWEKVVHKLRTGQMPPPGRPQPDRAERESMTTTLEAALDRAAVQRPDPGRVGIHRLNRTEYGNAIRDLLAVDVDVKALLLPDEADEGFDNVAASLALSPAHLERYLAAAREISGRAIGAVGGAPASSTYKVPKLLEQDVRISEDMPFGSRGGVAVRHQFPRDGEYAFKVRLRRQVYDYIVGMGHAAAARCAHRRPAHQTIHGRRRGQGHSRTADVEWRDCRRHRVGALYARGRRDPRGQDDSSRRQPAGERCVRRQPVGTRRRHAAAAGRLRTRFRRAIRRLRRG